MNKIARMISAMLLTAVSLSVFSCSKIDEQNYLGNIKVRLVAPEGAKDINYKEMKVKLLNVVDASERTAGSDENGIVSFSELTAGSYNLTVVSEKYSGSKNDVPVSSNETTEVDLPLSIIKFNEGLVVKEVFYSGHNYEFDFASATLMKDQFIELFNNSDKILYLDGLCIADIWTGATADMESAPTIPFLQDESMDHNFVYADVVIRIPGSGQEHALQPGESFLIATNAINFKEELKRAGIEMGMQDMLTPDLLAHIIDLSVADMETYAVDFLAEQGREGNAFFDLDNPSVPNMENVYFGEHKDFFFMDMSGAAPIVFKEERLLSKADIVKYTYQQKDNPVKSEMMLMKIPVEWVIDGADFVNNAESSRWKRLPFSIDAGFGFIPNDNGTLTNFSQKRKVDSDKSTELGRCVLADTDNTTNDFEPTNPPLPKAGMNI